MSETVLQEAERVIHGEKTVEYGNTKDGPEAVAKMWSVYLGRPISAADVSAMMILLKVCRRMQGAKRDTWVDIGGYTALGAVADGFDNE